jgi:single-stranded-DNA-specific exonuclease
MGNPRHAFNLLTTTSEDEATELAKTLEAVNRSRKASAGAITKSVHAKLERLREAEGDIPSVIVLGDPEWRPGLLGLVASGIADEYERPVFLWGREGNEALKGSCRGGPGNVHVVELMQEVDAGVLAGFGGHAAAGGFSVLPEAVFDLQKKFVEAHARLAHTGEVEDVRADLVLSANDITHALLKQLEMLAPFGMGNPKPTVSLQRVVIQRIAWFGKSSEHLRVHIKREEGSLEAIAFFARRRVSAYPCHRRCVAG